MPWQGEHAAGRLVGSDDHPGAIGGPSSAVKIVGHLCPSCASVEAQRLLNNSGNMSGLLGWGAVAYLDQRGGQSGRSAAAVASASAEPWEHVAMAWAASPS